MATIQPTSENKFKKYQPDSIVMPIDPATVLNQGSRVMLVANKIVPTTVKTDVWCGVSDGQNPVASLGDTLSAEKVLIKDNVIYFDAPTVEVYSFGDAVYAYDNGGNHYPGAVCKAVAGGGGAVGTSNSLTPITGGPGVRIPVKILPTQVI